MLMTICLLVSNACCSIHIIREQELDPKKQYIFGFHPHGIIIFSRVAWVGGSWEKTFPGITTRRTYRQLSVQRCLVQTSEANYSVSDVGVVSWSTCNSPRRDRSVQDPARPRTLSVVRPTLAQACPIASLHRWFMCPCYLCRLRGVDASRSTAEKVIKDGKSILVYPGGVAEIFLTEPESKEVSFLLITRRSQVLLNLV